MMDIFHPDRNFGKWLRSHSFEEAMGIDSKSNTVR